MTNTFRPWQLLSVIVAGMLNEQQQQQQQVIDFLKEEYRILREQLGGSRVLLIDDQRRRLAVRGKALSRKLLGEVCCSGHTTELQHKRSFYTLRAHNVVDGI